MMTRATITFHVFTTIVVNLALLVQHCKVTTEAYTRHEPGSLQFQSDLTAAYTSAGFCRNFSAPDIQVCWVLLERLESDCTCSYCSFANNQNPSTLLLPSSVIVIINKSSPIFSFHFIKNIFFEKFPFEFSSKVPPNFDAMNISRGLQLICI